MLKFLFGVLLTGLALHSAAGTVDCAQLDRDAEAHADAFYPRLSHRVTGRGRLPFHSAPDARCRLADVFVVPGDRLATYAAFGGWFQVMYVNPRSGEDVQGWVRSERLKAAGTLSPR